MVWYKCPTCKHIFVVPEVVMKTPKECPKCGSKKILKEEDYYDFNKEVKEPKKCPRCGSKKVKKIKA